jgi:hypothetical protein
VGAHSQQEAGMRKEPLDFERCPKIIRELVGYLTSLEIGELYIELTTQVLAGIIFSLFLSLCVSR